MLDTNIVKQLTDIFSKLETETYIILSQSDHPKQAELKQMLEDVCEVSKLLKIVESKEVSSIPHFKISKDINNARIAFSGVPGGHEFSSLILAILNVNSMGKLPDEVILNRIKNIKSPIDLKSFVSLECENCPDVVQALNLMSVYNEGISHEMVDGGMVQSEIDRLGIQGVPVVIDTQTEETLSVGKQDLLGLIQKLEENFGIKEQNSSVTIKNYPEYDVAVIGSGPAGASAAIYSARKGLKTLLLGERFGGQVKDTKGIENLISVPYTEGPQLSESLFKHVKEYEIDLLEHRRVDKIIKGEKNLLKLDSGEEIRVKALIIATGAKWRQLGIPGEKQYIGQGVAFCPHCDGPLFKNKKVAVVGGGNSGVEAALDLAKIVEHVSLIEFLPELKADKVLVDKLKALKNVTIYTNHKSKEFKGDDKKLTSVIMENRETQETLELELSGVFIQIGLSPNSEFLKDTLELTAHGEIVIDERGRTSSPGIFAAGDVTTVPFKQIIIAMGEGAKAALSAAEYLL